MRSSLFKRRPVVFSRPAQKLGAVLSKHTGATHATTGALVGQLGSVAGTAAHTAAAASHATSGALVGQLGTLASTALHSIPHASSGALIAPGAILSATSTHTGVGSTPIRRRGGGLWVKGKPPAAKPDPFAKSLHRQFTLPVERGEESALSVDSAMQPPPYNSFAAPALVEALASRRNPPKPPSHQAPPIIQPVVQIPDDILALLRKME